MAQFEKNNIHPKTLKKFEKKNHMTSNQIDFQEMANEKRQKNVQT